MGSRRGWRGEDAPAYAQCPSTGHRDVAAGASSQSRLGPGSLWPTTSSDRATGKWGCTGAKLWLCSPPWHPKTGSAACLGSPVGPWLLSHAPPARCQPKNSLAGPSSCTKQPQQESSLRACGPLRQTPVKHTETNASSK